MSVLYISANGRLWLGFSEVVCKRPPVLMKLVSAFLFALAGWFFHFFSRVYMQIRGALTILSVFRYGVA